MLELRPTCEHCNKALPPDSREARICSFECTFCADCVSDLLGDVCPNCGGGFVPRPVRPSRNWKGKATSASTRQATSSDTGLFRQRKHERFSAAIRRLAPENR